MAGILNAAGNVLGEVADYLRTEAEGLRHRKEEQHHGEGAATASHEGPPSTDATGAAPAADGARDSLYGPEGMNATAPDISGPAPAPEEGREAGREGGAEGAEAGLGDTLQAARARVSQAAQQVKDRFEEGYQQARERQAGADPPAQQQQQQQERAKQQEPAGTGGDSEGRAGGGGGGGSDFLETLREAKSRIDEENEQLKQRFREGYAAGQE